MTTFLASSALATPTHTTALAPARRRSTQVTPRTTTKAKAARPTQPASPTPLEQEAARLGFPQTLFGFTPNQGGYWAEPGLPWLTSDMYADFEKMPLDYRGQRALLAIGYMDGDHMAPRFPRGCALQTMPVWDKTNLVVGRVYTYRYWSEEKQEWRYEMGRLVKIGGNYLEVKADNHPTPSLWLLCEEPGQEVWDVREVTHYASYPDIDTLPNAG